MNPTRIFQTTTLTVHFRFETGRNIQTESVCRLWTNYKRYKVSLELQFLNDGLDQWLTCVSWREVMWLQFCVEYLYLFQVRFQRKSVLRYDVCSHNRIGVDIVYMVYHIFNSSNSNIILQINLRCIAFIYQFNIILFNIIINFSRGKWRK